MNNSYRLRNSWQYWKRVLIKILGGEPNTKEQIVEVLRATKQRGIMELDALTMIEGVLQVSELQARDIMIPRANIIAIHRNDSLEKILEIMRTSAHSRFPVIGDDRSEVIGLLIAKDLVAFIGRDHEYRRFNIRDILRSALFVPESKRLNVLLKDFRSSHNHMAIVVDEYGNAAGLVTIEDVLEQIVGDIEDEHDFYETTPIFKRSQYDYTLKSHVPIQEFNQLFHSNLPENEFDTIGGLVVNAIGHLPKAGECIDIESFRFKILRADSRKVHLLNLRLLPTINKNNNEQTI
jgi:magnesium and cobalt transporter